MRFVGGPWTVESRSGTFARFFEAHAGLERAAFLERVRSPFLAIGLDMDPRAWDQAVLVRLDKKSGPSDEVVVGRSLDADVTLNCPTMSKKHARFSHGEGDAWLLLDLGSAKGTLLDGKAIPPETKTPLAGPRPQIGFGPDVTATFLAPDALFQVVEEARARRAAGPTPPTMAARAVRAWPTWALLQDSISTVSTQHELPVYTPPAEGSPKPKVEIQNKVARTWGRQARELVASPKKIATTVAILAIVVVCFRIYGKPLAFMLFGSSHPEWFGE